MNCPKCGAELKNGNKFCNVCGYKLEETQSAGFGYGGTSSAPSARAMNNSFELNGGFKKDSIRKWFEGNRPKWPVVWTLIFAVMAIFTMSSGNAGGGIFMLLIAAVGGFAWYKTWAGVSDVSEVDAARDYYLDALSKRGYNKLNILAEQVNLIKPVVVAGSGVVPDSSFANAASNGAEATSKKSKSSIFGLIFGSSKKLLKKLGLDSDPYVAYRVGEDDVLRSMLLSVAVYMFSEKQVFVYSGNIDTSTGMIYNECTDEVFYEDIHGVHFEQDMFKVYSLSKKKYVNKVTETIVLYLSGCKLQADVNVALTDSTIDQQFMAMRNLIRDRRNA